MESGLRACLRISKGLLFAALMTGGLVLANGVEAPKRPGETTASPGVPAARQRLTPAARGSFDGAYANSPLHFEARTGAGDRGAGYLARGDGYELVLDSAGAELRLNAPSDGTSRLSAVSSPAATDSASRGAHGLQALRMSLVGATGSAVPVGIHTLPGKVNYLLGADASQWRTNVPTYAQVRYAQVYPGVDLIYYGNQRQLEYDFVVAPGADPRAISLGFEGAGVVSLDPSGDLAMTLGGRTLYLRKPVVYQDINGERREVASRYTLAVSGGAKSDARQAVSFEVGAYDSTRALVIDPVLSYATYLGRTGLDQAWDVAADAAGNIYVAGQTTSPTLWSAKALQPTYMGGQVGDAFVAKFNAAGVLLYCSYIGGDEDDGALGIALDQNSDVYVAGFTASTNFPTVNAFQKSIHGAPDSYFNIHPFDAFVLKMKSDGSALIYSTYLGGTNADTATAIAVDSAGNAYVTGQTQSGDFPTLNPIQTVHGGVGTNDAFVVKLNPQGGALVYGTLLGGYDVDEGQGIAVDPAGYASVVGFTASTNFPVVNPIQSTNGGGLDVFVVRLNPAGSALVFSTYLGGNDKDLGFRVAVDSAGNTYAVGETVSTNFPTANAIQAALSGASDAFVTKIDPTGATLVYSTYLGGTSSDNAWGVAVDSTGSAYVVGQTGSSDFPVVDPFQMSRTNAFTDAFITRVNPAGTAYIYSTYLGGSINDIAYAVSLDGVGHAYVVGQTASVDFPTVAPAQPNIGSATGNAFVVRIADGPSIPNDSFTNATPISGTSIRAGGSNVGATKESGEPNHAGVAGGDSVWWSWTAPSNGTLTITTAGSTFDTLLAVYTGSVVSNLTAVASNDNDPNGGASSRVTITNVAAGTSYAIAVDGSLGAAGTITLNLDLTVSPPPANDNFTNRIAISGTAAVVTGSNVGATEESGEPGHANYPGRHSVWWSWTAPSSGPITMTTTGSSFDTLLAVYTGSAVTALTPVAANDDDPLGGQTSRVTFNAVATGVYAIAVDAFGDQTGAITLNVGPSVAPANDNFTNSIAITGLSATVTGFNSAATKETGEPIHAGDAGGHSVWWSWTAPAGGPVSITTAGSSFDTLLGVYLGGTVSGLTNVVSNDDDPDGGVTSRVTFIAAAGATYRIAVDGKAGAVGNITLSVATLLAPANDNFTNRIALTGAAATVTGSNAGATKESGEPQHAGSAGGASVWYSWVAPANGPVTISTRGSAFDTLLAVYTGTSISNLVAVASNDDDPAGGQTSLVTFAAVAGTEYEIAVDGANGASGAISLSLAQSVQLAGASISGGQFQFIFHGIPGSRYLLQTSTNLVDWVSIGTNTLGGSTFNFFDASPGTLPRCFFRVQELR